MLPRFNYTRALAPHEVEVIFSLSNPDDESASLLFSQLALNLDQDLGFPTQIASLGDIRPSPSNVLARHLVVLQNGYDETVVNQVIALINNDCIHTASLAIRYENSEQFFEVSAKIEELKDETNNRLNFIYPDISEKTGHLSASIRKITANIMADTVRIRYKPRQLSNTLSTDLIDQVSDFFFAASRLYAKYHLFHRSSTDDGYLAMRCKEGVIVTASHTDKVDISLSRLVLIHNYDASTNTMTFSGPALPSSDGVEASIVFDKHRELNSIMHTHASDLFTRNSNYSHFQKIDPMPCGEAALGYELVNALSPPWPGFVIMKDHGEVFAGTDKDGSDVLGLVKKMCNESLARLT